MAKPIDLSAGADDAFGAPRAVRAAKAERRLWVPKRSAAADNLGRANFGVRLSATCSAMCAAKHDEGVYRLHALT